MKTTPTTPTTLTAPQVFAQPQHQTQTQMERPDIQIMHRRLKMCLLNPDTQVQALFRRDFFHSFSKSGLNRHYHKLAQVSLDMILRSTDRSS